MRTTVTIDDALYEQAAKRLAALGGSAPLMPSIPRCETEPPPQ
ncbi:hypothetical protein [Rhodoferax aquaticus]|nr:hypothetical protein [Rhodoferax aquaticus]